MNLILWSLRKDPTANLPIASLFAILYTLIILIGILGNVCVLLAINRTKSLQTVSNLFIFALSCSDIVVCFVSATFTPFTAFYKVWVFGSILCSLVPFIAGTSLCFSAFTLAAISVDRFLLIRFPLNNQLRHKHAFYTILIISLLSMILSLPMIFTQKLVKMDGYCGEFCFEHWSPYERLREVYGTILLIVQFVIPLSIITFCYTGISVRLNKQIYHQKMANQRRQRTNRMFVLMVFVFILSWIWTVLFNILRDFGLLPEFISEQEFLYGVITHVIAMTSTVWNPILYALLNVQLRNAFLNLIPIKIRKWLSKEKLAAANFSIAAEKSLNKFLLAQQTPSNCNNNSNNKMYGIINLSKRASSCLLPLPPLTSERNEENFLKSSDELFNSTSDIQL
ncbi:G_PROTEIN_RECEP_F1_2 domain-containing protein [Meloidogyne graminicola]|uniref:G_PROTEIN_RECEP_F1_2 domain-containing protein n=1 Tax=Meloidogyne graminicola TaxID=189291 RepID=A0A8T0A5V0_9BILA|nr:G_PROTEIN_RECEP_F1_2 domain-containing protein [Meloidogyne graminicola]